MRSLVIAFGLLALLITDSGSVKAGLVVPSIPGGRGSLKILSVGVNIYADALIPSIKYGVDDAEAVADGFRKAAQSGAFSGVEVTQLLDHEATSHSVIQALQDIAKNSKPEDTLLFYFGGMGMSDLSSSGQGRYYFLLADSKKIEVTKSSIEAGELGSLLLNIPARRQIVILDSLDSGLALDAVYRSLNKDNTFTLESRGRRFALLGLDGASMENDKLGHGIMTYALLDGLGGKADTNHDGVITEAELEAYLLVTLPHLRTNRYDEEQLRSYSNLHGLCLSTTSNAYKACDYSYGFPTEHSKSSSSERGAKSDEPEVATIGVGRNYALIVAGESYDHWPKLANPGFDAQTLQKELAANYGYLAKDITYVQDPTRQDIRAALRNLHQVKFGKNDRLLIFIAGHGDFTKLDGMGYLVTKDSHTAEADPDHDSFVTFGTLRDMIDTIPADHILVVLDVCYGGTFDQKLHIPGLQGNVVDQPVSREKVIDSKMQKKSRFYLTSGGVRSVNDGVPGEHSPFARAFLKTLRTYGGDQQLIDMGMLSGYLYKLNPQPRVGLFGSYEDGGDFVFIPREHPSKVADPTLN